MSRTVSQDLDWLQARLPNTDVWPRAELLGWYQDGYREMLTRSRAMRRLWPLDLPGRHSYAITQEWEDRHAQGGTFRKPSRTAAASSYQTSGLWEVESLAGVTPTDALAGYTQEWERAHIAGAVDHHFRFMFPRDHERIAYLSWQDRSLSPVTTRELDATDTNWMSQIGEPRWWTLGHGRLRTAEVYEVTNTYRQGYAQGDQGLPRRLSGERTYQAETQRADANTWAYTTTGDAEAFTVPNCHMPPATAYTASWERDYGPAPRFNFTVNLTMNYPGLSHTSVHPWELSAVGGPWIDSDEPSLLLDPLFHPESDQPIELHGLARLMTDDGDTGERTAGGFPWEIAFGAEDFQIALGGIRSVVSPERQYFPLDTDAQAVLGAGRISGWRSSESALMAVEVITAADPLAETDVPAMIPSRLQKYLRFYVLARAYGRVGEGRQPILADHFGKRFLAGVAFLKRLTDVANKDRVYTRDLDDLYTVSPPRVRFPSTFPVTG